MTAFLLATLLNLAPGMRMADGVPSQSPPGIRMADGVPSQSPPGIRMADNVSSRNVALSEARLPLLFVIDEDDDKRPSIDAMTREQLVSELRRLDETRPSLGGPIAAMSVGAVLAIVGGSLAFVGVSVIGFSGSAQILTYALLGLGGAIVIVGAILLLVGTIKLATRFGAIAAHRDETDEVQKRIDAIDQKLPPPPPGPEMLLPPPPPPPPQASRLIPGSMATLMTF